MYMVVVREQMKSMGVMNKLAAKYAKLLVALAKSGISKVEGN